MSSQALDQELSRISLILTDDHSTHEHHIAPILDILEKLKFSPSHQAQAWKVLADASRDEKWREPFGQNGLVAHCASALSDSQISEKERLQMLRFIGNCSADHDGNRRCVVDHAGLEAIGLSILDPNLASVASTVLFNVFNDYEPAQKASSPALANECLEALKNGWIDPRDSAYNCACQNLHMILQTLDIGQITTNDKGVLSDIISIVKYVAEWNKYIEDLDDYLPLLSSCIILLRHARAREEILNANLDHCFTVFQDASERLQTLQPDNDTIEQKPLLEGAQRELLEILCDVANGANASILNEQGSKSWRILRNWLGTNKEQVPEACFVCASLFLGNLARKDTVCESLVQEHNVHTYLIEHLQITNDHHALHAGGGCLRNISVPQKNKEMIAEAGAFVVIMLLLQLNEMRGLPYVGACIARQLINSSFSNVKRLISTNAQSRPDSVPRSCLDALLQASIESDDFAVKAEVARAIPAVFRVLSGAKEVEDTIDDVRRQIISHPDILSPVMAVLQQEKSQPLRSEGWFTLALIAQSNEGAKIVAEALGDEDILRILREQMKGGEIDGQREESTLQKGADKERENAIVLVTSLLQKDGAIDGHRMPETQRENFENLLKEQKVGLLKS